MSRGRRTPPLSADSGIRRITPSYALPSTTFDETNNELAVLETPLKSNWASSDHPNQAGAMSNVVSVVRLRRAPSNAELLRATAIRKTFPFASAAYWSSQIHVSD